MNYVLYARVLIANKYARKLIIKLVPYNRQINFTFHYYNCLVITFTVSLGQPNALSA